jgi:hypothetical protein
MLWLATGKSVTVIWAIACPIVRVWTLGLRHSPAPALARDKRTHPRPGRPQQSFFGNRPTFASCQFAHH